MAENEPGVFTLDNGKVEYYKPSEYEVVAFERLQRAIINL